MAQPEIELSEEVRVSLERFMRKQFEAHKDAIMLAYARKDSREIWKLMGSPNPS